MIYLIIGFLGLAFFKRDTVVELFEIAVAFTLSLLDRAWDKVFN